MTYQSDKMQLNCIQTILVSDCNDIYVCVDEKTSTQNKYMVLVIKSHDIIKKYIEISSQVDYAKDLYLVDHFSEQGKYVLVFPYIKRRPLKDFYISRSLELVDCEDICSNLVLSCIQSGLPFPLLYEVIKQGQLNLNRDHSIYITYELDLSELDETKTEKDCVIECARILLSLFESKQKQKAISYTLLQKKIRSQSYSRFTELYKDITIAAQPKKKLNIVGRIKALWKRSKDGLFRLFLVLCVLLIVFAALSLVSQVIFGDVPWLRIFFNNFKQIGTESLIQ